MNVDERILERIGGLLKKTIFRQHKGFDFTNSKNERNSGEHYMLSQ